MENETLEHCHYNDVRSDAHDYIVRALENLREAKICLKSAAGWARKMERRAVADSHEDDVDALASIIENVDKLEQHV